MRPFALEYVVLVHVEADVLIGPSSHDVSVQSDLDFEHITSSWVCSTLVSSLGWLSIWKTETHVEGTQRGDCL